MNRQKVRTIQWLAAATGIGLSLVAASCGGLVATQSADAPASESITNNQEAGVDEGGIVKAAGDVLVVLRRGRIFTVGLGDQAMRPICREDAYPDEELGSWYDEMLIHDRTVVVIGYSYRMGATEIGLFDLDAQGCVAHRSTHFLRSNDYFSTRNYASRLIEGKLVFYMPHYLGSFAIENGQVQTSTPAPALQAFGEGQWNSVLASAELTVPAEVRSSPTLHTVVSCELAPEFSCDAHGIIGESGRTFYVSPRAVYVWVGSPGGGEEPNAIVYRLPFGQEPPGAVRVWGMPTDQFSFREADGHLNVLVRSEGGGDWMGHPERVGGSVDLVRIPLLAFARPGAPTLATNAYTPLPEPQGSGHAFQNRFVGDYVLYGKGISWGGASAGQHATLYAHSVGQQRPTRALRLSHGIDRIEALGEDAVVIGSDGDNLLFSSFALAEGRPRMIDRYARSHAVQGETRSHGFFYKPSGEREGVFGLPVRREGPGAAHLRYGSAEIVYLKVQELRFDPLGELRATNDSVDDDCRVSCVDWYGNARPIFYRGRVFALLGYELVEGKLTAGPQGSRIREVGRTHLVRDLPDPTHVRHP
ncbi:MAG: beta-propeller domain-containing protein [Myxococcota bacterium]